MRGKLVNHGNSRRYAFAFALNLKANAKNNAGFGHIHVVNWKEILCFVLCRNACEHSQPICKTTYIPTVFPSRIREKKKLIVKAHREMKPRNNKAKLPRSTFLKASWNLDFLSCAKLDGFSKKKKMLMASVDNL